MTSFFRSFRALLLPRFRDAGFVPALPFAGRPAGPAVSTAGAAPASAGAAAGTVAAGSAAGFSLRRFRAAGSLGGATMPVVSGAGAGAAARFEGRRARGGASAGGAAAFAGRAARVRFAGAVPVVAGAVLPAGRGAPRAARAAPVFAAPAFPAGVFFAAFFAGAFLGAGFRAAVFFAVDLRALAFFAAVLRAGAFAVLLRADFFAAAFFAVLARVAGFFAALLRAPPLPPVLRAGERVLLFFFVATFFFAAFLPAVFFAGRVVPRADFFAAGRLFPDAVRDFFATALFPVCFAVERLPFAAREVRALFPAVCALRFAVFFFALPVLRPLVVAMLTSLGIERRAQRSFRAPAPARGHSRVWFSSAARRGTRRRAR